MTAPDRPSPAPPAPSPPRKPIIGLAGGIGSGKTLVAKQFESLGCGVIDADALAREAFDQPQVQQALRQWWGDGVFDERGRVDRAAIARRVFDDPQLLRRLENLIHPRVHAARHEMRRRLMTDPAVRAIIEDCPLLFEKGIDRECDVTVFVEADRATRLARLAASRGWSEADLDRREAVQWPLDTKAERADYKVSNGSQPQGVLEQVQGILEQVLGSRGELE